jgi:hypothetical protein
MGAEGIAKAAAPVLGVGATGVLPGGLDASQPLYVTMVRHYGSFSIVYIAPWLAESR